MFFRNISWQGSLGALGVCGILSCGLWRIQYLNRTDPLPHQRPDNKSKSKNDFY
eukprot:m.138565 g.138565  ORF g.138565 m.138565 type:complete len:54 (-) comp30002_c0_seq1:721-882(-)